MKHYVERNGNKGWGTIQRAWGSQRLRTMDVHPFSSWEQRRAKKIRHRWGQLYPILNE